MFSWLKGKVTGEHHSEETAFGSFSKDEDGAGSPGSTTKNTLVVVRDGAVPKMTLDSNEIQLLKDIPEFKPFLTAPVDIELLNKLDSRALLGICKTYQDHMMSCSESVSTRQSQLAGRMKEIDHQVKAVMDRLADRQRSYAKCAEQLNKTPDMTQQIKKLRRHVKETEEMLKQLNDNLPEGHRLEPFSITESLKSSTSPNHTSAYAVPL